MGGHVGVICNPHFKEVGFQCVSVAFMWWIPPKESDQWQNRTANGSQGCISPQKKKATKFTLIPSIISHWNQQEKHINLTWTCARSFAIHLQHVYSWINYTRPLLDDHTRAWAPFSCCFFSYSLVIKSHSSSCRVSSKVTSSICRLKEQQSKLIWRCLKALVLNKWKCV